MKPWCCGLDTQQHAQQCAGTITQHPTRHVPVCNTCGHTVYQQAS